jgi:hypothetical protein
LESGRAGPINPRFARGPWSANAHFSLPCTIRPAPRNVGSRNDAGAMKRPARGG